MNRSRIMIVEDEAIVAFDIHERLERMGYEVACHAMGGGEAVEKALAGQPDLILMDIMLGDGVDGISASEEIRKHKDIPVIYLTAYSDTVTLMRARITEPYGYIIKPFEDRELHSAIEMAMYRHRIEHKLRESERLMSALLGNIGEALISVDGGGRITFINPRAKDIITPHDTGTAGRLAGECIALSEGGVPFPVDKHVMEAIANSETMRFIDLTLKAPDKTAMVDLKISPMKGERGESTGAVLLLLDISARKLAEQSAKASELRFRSVFDAATDAIVLANKGGAIVAWNGGAERVFGYAASEVMGKPITMLMPLRYRDLHTNGMRRVTDGGNHKIIGITVELSGIRKYGEEFPLELSLNLWDEGGEPFFSGIVRDITGRKRAERELEMALGEMNVILETATVGMALLRGRRLMRVNRAFLDMFGLSRDETAGMSTERLYESIEAYERFGADAYPHLAEGKFYKAELRMRKKNRELFWCNLSGSAIDASDSSKGSIWILEDISARKLAEEEIAKALDRAEGASRAKSQFLANMSHEIRTPMNGIIGMSELVMDTELTAEQAEYISIVKQSADSLLGLLNNILDFSKVEAGRVELEQTEFDLLNLVEAAVETLAAQAQRKGLALQRRISPALPKRLLGDPGRLRQVIINLIGNSIKFTERGEVTLNVEPSSVSHNSEDVVTLRCTVSDTGIGIPKDKIDWVFESFSQVDGSLTRQYGGTGLGLSISKQLVTLMGGKIWAESEPGKGSTFHFTASFKVPAGLKKGDSGEPRLLGENVLVIFETGSDRAGVEYLLREWGLDAVYAPASAPPALKPDAMPRAILCLYSRGAQLTPEVYARLTASGVPVISIAPPGVEAPGMGRIVHTPLNNSELFDNLAVLFEDSLKREITKSAPVHPKTGLRILLAEDNAVNQKLATIALARANHKVDIVNNGKEALDALSRGKYDLVLMDIQMPVMDGTEAVSEIRSGRHPSIDPSLPVIAMTAHAIGGDMDKFINAGMDGYISKPFRIKELLERIDTAMANKCASPRPAAGSAPEESPEPSAQPIIDIDDALGRLDGDRELLADIWKDFIELTPAQIDTIKSSLDSGDIKTLEREAHSLKSTSGSIGARGLREAAWRVERGAREKDGGISEFVSALVNEYNVVIEELKRITINK